LKLPSNDWKDLRFWKSDKWRDLRRYLEISSINSKKEILPHHSLWFRALNETAKSDTNVVIIGQDPYHTPGFATGLAFGCQPGVRQLPASLANIYKEYVDDLGYKYPRSGDLTSWSRNGILLLNSCLTVEAGRPNSHKGKGWELLTYEIIKVLSMEKRGIVFLLWGEEAKLLSGAIDTDHNHIISSGHPSPLAFGAAVPFLGSRPFSRALAYNPAIDWKLR
jgi:uracil-DNA glycosylase